MPIGNWPGAGHIRAPLPQEQAAEIAAIFHRDKQRHSQYNRQDEAGGRPKSSVDRFERLDRIKPSLHDRRAVEGIRLDLFKGPFEHCKVFADHERGIIRFCDGVLGRGRFGRKGREEHRVVGNIRFDLFNGLFERVHLLFYLRPLKILPSIQLFS